MTGKARVEAGVVAGVHGIKGEVRFKAAGPLDEWAGLTLYAGQGDGAKGFKIVGARLHKGLVLMTVEGITTRNDAELLVGTVLYIDEKDLPAPGEGEYYYYQLIGMDVYAEDGSRLGVLSEVIETGANDVFKVTADSGSETLFAALSDVILSVDVQARRMTIRPPLEVEADEADDDNGRKG